MTNKSILAAFERMWGYFISALNNKSDSDHVHNDLQEQLEEKTTVQIIKWEVDD